MNAHHLPRYPLHARSQSLQPHVQGIVAGGASEIPTVEKLAEYASRFKEVQKFIKYAEKGYAEAGSFAVLF